MYNFLDSNNCVFNWILSCITDIFSPISRNSKGGKVPSGTQINSKTSPHPLRQSYSAANADKQESSVKLRNSAPAPPTKKFLHPKPQAENYLKEETKTSSLPNSSTPSSIDSTKKINFLPDKSAFPSESAPSHNGGEISLIQLFHLVFNLMIFSCFSSSYFIWPLEFSPSSPLYLIQK